MTLKLCIGTAQFGMPYGIASSGDGVSDDELKGIVSLASQIRIGYWDTAHGYGISEERLGHYLDDGAKLITKLPSSGSQAIDNAAVAKLRAAFDESLRKLRRRTVYGLLVHDTDDLRKVGAERLSALLLHLKESGYVEKIGFSIYREDQLRAVLSVFTPDLVQMPVSVLDQRLIHSPVVQDLAASGVELHARSIFLQGLLLMAPERIPRCFASHLDRLHAVRKHAEKLGCSTLTLCVRYATAHQAIRRVVVGVDTVRQLEEVAAASEHELPSDDLAHLASSNPDLLEPNRWPR